MLESKASIEMFPSHVAILVPSARKAADFFKQFNFHIGNEDLCENEGTREIYVGREKANSLLLMEAIGPGPYQRAMEKRGPGIHHLAIDVLNLEVFLDSIFSSGWLLHPISVKSIKQIRVAYLARPEFPALIEVQESKEISDRPLFVNKLTLSILDEFHELSKYIGLSEIIERSDRATLCIDEKVIAIKELF